MEGVAGVGERHRLTDVKARHDKMVGLFETMQATADDLRHEEEMRDVRMLKREDTR